MGRDRFLQALQIITALEYRNNAPLGGFAGKIHQPARHPPEILRLQVERGERIAEVTDRLARIREHEVDIDAVARTRVISVYVDQDFAPAERDRIVSALRQWNLGVRR